MPTRDAELWGEDNRMPRHALVRVLLENVAKRQSPITYQELTKALQILPPHPIHRVTEALGHLMEEDAAADRPFIAALAISRARGGLPVGNNVALMRGHGFAAAGRSLIEVVRMSVYLPRNARALQRAKQLGGSVKYLSQGEIDARNRGYSPYSTETWRAWEYWANKAGVGHLLTRPEN
jgi:ribulose-5-phosphate 4-epimerase/fuculose-1-phosphate aldolase